MSNRLGVIKMSKQKKEQQITNNRKSRIELYKRSTFRKKNEKPENGFNTIMRVVKYLYAEKKLLVFVISLLFFSIVATLSSQVIKIIIIDDFIKKGISDGFLLYIIILACLYIFQIITSYLSSYFMIGISQRTLRRMRINLFKKIQALSISFFDQNRDGDLMIRITNDVDNISSTMTQTFVSFISSMMTLILTIALMIWLNWKLTIVALITIPLIYFAAKTVSASSRKRFRKMRYERGALNGFVAEQINGAKVIQSFCQEEQIIDEFSTESNRVKKITISALTWASLMNPVIGLLNNLRYIIIVTTGAILAINGDPQATVGIITAFITLANLFGGKINLLANMYTDIQNALSGAERVFDILDNTSEIKDKDDAITLENGRGHVELKHVDFEYIENTPILKDVSINATPGKKIALVGHTGAGKTTIINLLTRFYDVKKGVVLIDGVNIQDITHDSLLSHVGIVLQDTNLFSDTIYNNILLGKLDTTKEEIENACKLANCHEFICELPNGYDTVLARNGSNISFGQRQLLSIARTILKNPDILILDEATSSVDTITEKQIQYAIENLTKDKTSFIIAHRLSTIRNADLIIVMNDGQIVEQGSHEELLNLKGKYYQLHNSKDSQDFDDFEKVSA